MSAGFDSRGTNEVAGIAVAEESLAHAKTFRVKRDLANKNAALAACDHAISVTSTEEEERIQVVESCLGELAANDRELLWSYYTCHHAGRIDTRRSLPQILRL